MKRTFLLTSVLMVSLITSHVNAVPAYKKNVQVQKAQVRIPSGFEISNMEKKLIDLINNERVKFGYARMTEWSVLSDYARGHSQNMAQGKVKFGHGGFEERAEGVKSYAKHTAFGENVAYCYGVKDPLASAIKGWMNSQGHKDNILGDYDQTGIGIVYSKDGYCYLTQLFAKKRKTRNVK
jgi:uncharacterized protein YkwD